jgi:CRP/FNR family transcriptional regulator, nitrogen oxide reductase regulator
MTRANTAKPFSLEVIKNQNLEAGSPNRESSASLSEVNPSKWAPRGKSPSEPRVQTSHVSLKLPDLARDGALGCIRRAPLFRGLSFQQHGELASIARQCDYGRRKTIFRENDPIRSVFVIASGRVKTTQLSRGGKEVLLRVDKRGEVLDGFGLFPGETHSVTAQTIEPCRVFSWEVQAFDAFAERVPMLHRNAVGILSARLRMLQERFRDMATKRVPQRLARLLLDLFNQSTENTSSTAIDLSCEELAQMTGTTLFTVSRLLCDWAEQGIIQPERKMVVVESLPALLQVAEETAEMETA